MKPQYKPISFLDSNLSLTTDKRKLLNFLVSELYESLVQVNIPKDKQNLKLPLTTSRFGMHQSLDSPGAIKFRISKVVKDLQNLPLYLARKQQIKKNRFIESITLDKKNIIFTMNPIYNDIVINSPIFIIDQDVQKDITRKNMLLIYELIMSILCEKSDEIVSGSTINKNINTSDIIKMTGTVTYHDGGGYDLFRNVIKVAVKQLNKIDPGFTVSAKSNLLYNVVDSISIDITISDSQYFRDLGII